ncbi:multidrug DMT transporter permease [Lentisphaerota bacterium ZTH]|nr:multidrug DMT transporter permease [Lentisphaerota bacterium]WET05366.1 multidrug DMT transporter permease [Lentisphaerota bacterium ZTH]
MFIVQSYTLAVIMCVITMLCWGSWANTQKLASKSWRFQLFYWDYAIGIVILSLILAFTLGSHGVAGRGFIADLNQASASSIGLAILGGIIFNAANILLVAAIDIAGMAVAFPIGIGLALVIGVIANYVPGASGNPYVLFAGVAGVTLAIILDAVAYKRLSGNADKVKLVKGILISLIAGILMGFFYRFVAESMSFNFSMPEAGKMTPYSAVFIFSLGIFLSNFVFNTLVSRFPFSGEPVKISDYITKGTARLHLIGIIGGMIWGLGMSFSILAAEKASASISYGLGQGATLVAALWGVFIWREFRSAPQGTNKILSFMFLCYVVGLALIIAAKLI